MCHSDATVTSLAGIQSKRKGIPRHVAELANERWWLRPDDHDKSSTAVYANEVEWGNGLQRMPLLS